MTQYSKEELIHFHSNHILKYILEAIKITIRTEIKLLKMQLLKSKHL